MTSWAGAGPRFSEQEQVRELLRAGVTDGSLGVLFVGVEKANELAISREMKSGCIALPGVECMVPGSTVQIGV